MFLTSLVPHLSGEFCSILSCCIAISSSSSACSSSQQPPCVLCTGDRIGPHILIALKNGECSLPGPNGDGRCQVLATGPELRGSPSDRSREDSCRVFATGPERRGFPPSARHQTRTASGPELRGFRPSFCYRTSTAIIDVLLEYRRDNIEISISGYVVSSCLQTH